MRSKERINGELKLDRVDDEARLLNIPLYLAA